MIEAILPDTVIVAEARHDGAPAFLHPQEEALVGAAVEKRRREFATGRACAHRALERLGAPPGPILSGEGGEPLWPAGVVATITHCRDYRGCAAAREADLVALGIDAEPHAPLPAGLVGDIAAAEERRMLDELVAAEPSVHWDRLLFSAKESVYKTWFPLARRWLGFEDVLLTIDRGERTFSARLLVPGPAVGGVELSGFRGRWLIEDGLVLTAIAVSR